MLRSAEVLSQAKVETELLRLSDRLETETSRLLELGQAAGEAEVVFKRERAKAYLMSRWPDVEPGSKPGGKPSVDVKTAEMMADILSSKELGARLLADVAYQSCREICRMVRDQISALQSVNGNIRASV
jgi:hypothetical protein